MIHFDHVWFKYPGSPAWALRDFTAHIAAGECVGVMGQNGAGKSTLIRHMNGLLLPTKGDVFVNRTNTRYSSVAKLAASVGIVFQNPDHQLFSDTVEGELDFSLKHLDVDPGVREFQKKTTIEEFQIEPFLKRAPFNLSGGERKRVSMASLYCRYPIVLVLDEPTLGQDHAQKEKLGKLVNRLMSEGKTVVVVTHDLEFAAEYLPRIWVVHRGVLVADGTPREVFTNETVLNASALTRPQVTRLSGKLHESNPEFPADLLTVEEFITHFKRKVRVLERERGNLGGGD
ncbi:MAG: energy-coupling factor ABC transporter ATP-binding protein [Promethearchaeota archaeon]